MQNHSYGDIRGIDIVCFLVSKWMHHFYFSFPSFPSYLVSHHFCKPNDPMLVSSFEKTQTMLLLLFVEELAQPHFDSEIKTVVL